MLSPQGYTINDDPKNFNPFFIDPEQIPANILDMIDEINSELVTIEASISSLQTSDSNFTAQIAQISRSLSNLTARVEYQIVPSITTADNKATSAQETATTALNTANTANELAGNLRTQYVELDAQVDTVLINISSINQTILELQYQLSQKASNTDLSEINTQLEELSASVETVSNALSGIADNSALQQLSSDITLLQGDIQTLTTRADGQDTTISIIQQNVGALNNNVAALDSSVVSLDERVTELEKKNLGPIMFDAFTNRVNLSKKSITNYNQWESVVSNNVMSHDALPLDEEHNNLAFLGFITFKADKSIDFTNENIKMNISLDINDGTTSQGSFTDVPMVFKQARRQDNVKLIKQGTSTEVNGYMYSICFGLNVSNIEGLELPVDDTLYLELTNIKCELIATSELYIDAGLTQNIIALENREVII